MIAKAYMNYGLSRETVLSITGLTKHSFLLSGKVAKHCGLENIMLIVKDFLFATTKNTQ